MADQNVTVNITANVDQFALALNRVNQQARRTFAQLQELSQRYQSTGFLGMADQRTLEQGIRQWERMTQVMELRTRGAAARVQELVGLGGGTGTPAERQMRIMQAQGVLERLTLHQQGLGTLRGAVSNLFAGTPPGMTNVFTPPGPRRLTALQAAHLIEQQQVATAQRFEQQQRGAAAMADLPLTQRDLIAAQMLTNLTPLQQAHMAQFGMPATPLQQAHATLMRERQAQHQQGLQQAQLVSLMAQMGPQRVFQPGALGAMALQGGANLVGAIQRPARLALGAAAGFGVYQTLTESMDLYRQRAQGIIDVGMRLDLNFAHVGTTIDTLRTKYQTLAQDSIAAQLAMTRILGGTGGLDPAVRAGAAYGVAAPQAAALAGTLSRLTRPGTAPLSTVAALAGMTRPGITPMAVEELWEETTRIAGVGGAAATRVGVETPARWMNFITSLGERYNVPGAASQFFGQFAAGVNQAPDATTQAIRIRALRNLARRRGPMLRVGDEEFDLRTMTGQRMAMEQASQSPDILEAYRTEVGNLFGADPEQRELAFQAIVGTGLSLTESRRVRREAERRGGFGGMGASATSVTQTQEAIETLRLQERAAQPEFQIAITQALKEAGLERLGEPLVTASNQLKQALIGMTEMLREGRVSWEGLQQSLGTLDDTTKVLLGSLGMLGSQSILGQAASAFTLLSGLFGAPPAQPGFEVPVLGNPFERVPPRAGPSLIPQR